MLVLGLLEMPFWLVLGICGLVLWAWYDYERTNGKFRKMGIPYKFHLPIVGNMWVIVGTLIRGWRPALTLDYKAYERIYGSVFFGHASINVSDQELLKRILIKDAHCFIDRKNLGATTKPFKDGILNLKGDSWRRIRHLLTPTFSAGKLKAMTPLLQETIATLKDVIDDDANTGNEFAFIDKAGAFTMESIAKTMFAINSNAQRDPNDAFLHHGKNMMKVNIQSPLVLLLFLFPPIAHVYNYFEISMFPKKDTEFFSNAVTHTIEERHQNGNASLYHDFLSLMMRAHEETNEGSSKKALTTDEMLAQAFIFFLAGYETSANTFDMLMYFLAAHPDVQDKVFQEIDAHVGEERVTYDNVRQLDYLENCLAETGRMHTQAIVLNRAVTENITIGGISFQKGDTISIPSDCIHHDPEFWPEPETFKPERFQENPELTKSVLYLPFGAGPRNCIGIRLAQVELKMATVELLRHFRFKLGHETPKNYADIKWGPNPVKPAKPLLFKVERRNN